MPISLRNVGKLAHTIGTDDIAALLAVVYAKV